MREPKRSDARKVTHTEVFKGQRTRSFLRGAQAGRAWGVSEKGPRDVGRPGRKGAER